MRNMLKRMNYSIFENVLSTVDATQKTSQTSMYWMFGGSAYLFVIIKYFSFAFLYLFLLQRNLFPLRLCHQTSATKLRYLRSSAFHRQPKFVSMNLFLMWQDTALSVAYCKH